ncbi:U-box domain-containing protein 5-like [Zingiber officinale]|uniref:U-box domain-containing protein 5-like n=1 Tax=Zingiber officinale TaxID=94328 RepID=UPI001C4D232C|nr:U-box domain-containing protein 5-like [Zingiber officinale]XP_042441117.1 U-box domain-containing protein 5-like [Zingiber officinale]
MGKDVPQIVKDPQKYAEFKANNSICSELTKILDKIHLLLPAIESTRPGYNSGIQVLCSLNNQIEKAKLLLQYCAESSKLYLAITGEATLSRCERIRSSLIHSLSQMQGMVPPPLESKIAEVVDYLRVAKFIMDSQEEEAGRALLDLLRQTNFSEDLEIKTFEIAASRLNMTSPKAILIERRSLRKMLDNLSKSDSKKEKIVNYFLYLLNKYGKNVGRDNSKISKTCTDSVGNFSSSVNNGDPSDPADDSIVGCQATLPTEKFSSTYSVKHVSSSEHNGEPTDTGDAANIRCQAAVPPEEFFCPISLRLMYDPVVIASGQTYERMYIEKWFHDGHNTCPKTQRKLENFSMVPNSCLQELITNWLKKNSINVVGPCSGYSPADYHSWEAAINYSISSLNDVSAALLDGNTGRYFLQNDYSDVSLVSSSSVSNCSNSSHVNITEKLKINHTCLFPWSDDYQQYHSFSNFNHQMFLRFFCKLMELPTDVQGKAVENMKALLETDEEISHAMLENGFVEALISMMKTELEAGNAHGIKSGTQLFLAFLSANRVDLSSLTEDVSWWLISFLNSELNAEALMLLEKLIQCPSYRSKMVASGLVTSIINLLDPEHAESHELSLKILLELSDEKDIKSHILTSECLSKLATFLMDGKLVCLCLKLLENISNDKEGAQLVAKSNVCLASIAEVLSTGIKDEQEYAVAILYSICSCSFENSLLVMDEGVVPALVEISVNGNSNSKEISMRLLHHLRNIRQDDRFYLSPESKSEPAETLSVRSSSRQLFSKPDGFLRRKLRFFSKQRPLTPC